uniref:VWFD domain-containing protein n=1 Tax=Myripristis murdjan TaxID=586833 RepID=A0A667WPA6_9TELE
MDNCTTAICVNGKVIKTPAACPTAPQPICANGRKLVKVPDSTGCCFHYECECVCSGWSKSHYLTFDGKNYTFKENCSYYLVKEIVPKYNLTIIVDNHYCNPSGSSFCPQALIVNYESDEVVLTQFEVLSDVLPVLQVYVNGRRVYPAYSNGTFIITSTDMVVTLEIPDIETMVVYRGSSFSIDLPQSLFSSNTEGQCGTCDNSQQNDCRSPNGQLESCSVSAGQWRVPGTSCGTTPPPLITFAPTTPQPTTPTKAPCSPDQCHSVVPVAPFEEACRSDKCNETCVSLEAYALECSNKGVCINWRNATSGHCEPKCPVDKVYKPCGTTVEPTCNERYNEKFGAEKVPSGNITREGCFCPDDTTLFNTVYGVCVVSCDCVGPDGKPKQPGDTWTSGCHQCVCDRDSMSIQCEPVQCPSTPSLNCSKPGQRLVNNTDGCCPKLTCGTPHTPGFEYQPVAGECCGKCVQTACIITLPDNTTAVIQVNQTWSPPGEKCVRYTCTNSSGPPILEKSETVCPPYDPQLCVPVSLLRQSHHMLYLFSATRG